MTRPPPYWEHFEHKADIGVRGIGNTLDEAFAQAAVAMTAVVSAPNKIRSCETVSVSARESDTELLLVDWLNAVIFEMTTRNMLFARFEVTLREDGLDATLYGETVDVGRHQPAVEIKGATYTELQVTQYRDGRWCAQCVVDV